MNKNRYRKIASHLVLFYRKHNTSKNAKYIVIFCLGGVFFALCSVIFNMIDIFDINIFISLFSILLSLLAFGLSLCRQDALNLFRATNIYIRDYMEHFFSKQEKINRIYNAINIANGADPAFNTVENSSIFWQEIIRLKEVNSLLHSIEKRDGLRQTQGSIGLWTGLSLIFYEYKRESMSNNRYPFLIFWLTECFLNNILEVEIKEKTKYNWGEINGYMDGEAQKYMWVVNFRYFEELVDYYQLIFDIIDRDLPGSFDETLEDKIKKKGVTGMKKIWAKES